MFSSIRAFIIGLAFAAAAPAHAEEPTLLALLDRGFQPVYALPQVIIDQCSAGSPVTLDDNASFLCSGPVALFYSGAVVVVAAGTTTDDLAGAFLCTPKRQACLPGEVVRR